MSLLNLFKLSSGSDTVTLTNGASDTDSQYRLGCRYANGVGVAKDYVQAYRWLRLAANRGHTLAGEVCDSVAARMSPQAIAEAEKLVADLAAAA
jgi:TPR repeat protein